jgi:hypothetical protein
MSLSVIEELLSSMPAHDVAPIGFDEGDLRKVELLYDVRLKGQFKQFLLEAGKSDGGLIGDAMMPLYRPTWHIRDHFVFQYNFFNEMQEEGFYEFLNKPFVVSLLSDSQYYFIQTSLEKSDVIYHYDSNGGEVNATEWDLLGFLKVLLSYNEGVLQTPTIGHLLDI